MKLKATLVLLVLSMSSVVAQVTTEGRDFWFGFMDSESAESLEIYLTAKDTSEVTVTAPLIGYDTTVTVFANSSVTISLPLSLLPEEEGVFNKGVHVTSDNDISVYQLNKRAFSADATVILPTNVLGKDYFVMAHHEPKEDATGADLESQVLIVATADQSVFEVIPSVETFNGLKPGVPIKISLDAGQTYQLKSKEDLSGTRVTTVVSESVCGGLAVFGGNKFTNVGGCGGNNDHLIEQMFPIRTWGREFLFVPYATRKGGDYLKLMASEDTTSIEISGIGNITLNQGEMKIFKAIDGVREISSDKPIQIAQLSRSESCDGVPSDPFMIMLSPQEQRLRQITFNAFDLSIIDQYYLTLITQNGKFSDVEIDGINISDQFSSAGNSAYSILEISEGTHTLTAPDGVIAYVYGYGRSESFGYAAGVSLENLNPRIEGFDAQIGIVEKRSMF